MRFDYPASLWVQYDARGMKETENSEKNGRKVVEWVYANPKPVKGERKNFSVYDPEKEVGFRLFDIQDLCGHRGCIRCACVAEGSRH